ncbi:MAG: SagB/ThcOx family dehydrogenase [Nitrospira sp.]|nr:SagB/ThcOx family dehydrogenase [Nitrospira sp.]
MNPENLNPYIAGGSTPTDPIDRIIYYHLRTKHQFNQYARSLGYLDWANQPNPFRRFEGAQLISLPLLKPDEEPFAPVYDAIYERAVVTCQPVSLSTLSRFFEFALALSAWKKAGESEWALRSNPSSGNLHPTEGYVVLPQIHGLDLAAGLYHYAPKEHGLELRAEFPVESVAPLLASFPSGAFLFGLTSVHWREAWKYGERAFRYCNHDVGHAIATARIAAATLGWNMVLLEGMDSASSFFQMMQRVMPLAECSQLERPVPWDAWPYDPVIHLLIFVHRVDGLTSGLYCLVRDSRKVSFVQQAMNPELIWSSAPGCPADLPFYGLLEGDARKLAVQVSCHQDIAGDSAFSFGMVAEFEGTLRERGAWWYPRLFWEAGLLGQIMYLEAEAAGVRATGIGCFFDDPVHEIVGIQNLAMQSVYHFTVGGPVEDQRLQVLPPYGHLRRER